MQAEAGDSPPLEASAIPEPPPAADEPLGARLARELREAAGWKWGLAAVVVVSVFLRVWGLETPTGLVFDEAHYATAARVMAGVVAEPDHGAWSTNALVARSPDQNFVHPPLGKLLIAVGIDAVGDTGEGRRLPSVLFGLASLLVFFLIAKELLGSPAQAAVALTLLAADGLHVVQSRIAMLEMFHFTFGLLGWLGLLKMLRAPDRRAWRVFAGVAWGLALAVKLNAILGALGCSILWVWLSPLGLKARLAALLQVMLAAILVYVAVDGGYFMLHGFSFREWIDLRTLASTALAGNFPPHQYGSTPGEWLWNKKPIWYAFERVPEHTSGIVALGNPAVWFAFLPASYLVFSALRQRWHRTWDPEARAELPRDLIPIVWFLATYLPLHLVLWRREGFLYYMLPSTAPMCLVITRALFQSRPEDRPWVVGSYLALVALALFALVPVLIDLPVPEAYFTQLFKFISA